MQDNLYIKNNRETLLQTILETLIGTQNHTNHSW